MKIYYNADIRYEGAGIRGRRQLVDWRFEYAGMRCIVPAVYRFPQGIVFDIIGLTDEAQLQEFFKKYPAEASMSSVQMQHAEQEHPFQSIPVQNMWINGKPVEDGISYSYSVSIPWAQPEDSLSWLRKAYSGLLYDMQPFSCQRVCVEYPKAARHTERLLRYLRLNKISGLRFITEATQWFYPLDISIELPVGNVDCQVEFLHPVTEQLHRLYFNETEIQELPMSPHTLRRLYILLVQYELDPPLPEDSSIRFSSSISCSQPAQKLFSSFLASDEFADPDESQCDGDDIEPCEEDAASIGVIGGADGPTAIFIGQADCKHEATGPHGLPLQSCFSVPGTSKSDFFTVTIEGISVRQLDRKTVVLGSR